jgi:hypothetical protein
MTTPGHRNGKSVMTTIRIPHDMMDLLKAAAAAENRSLANYLVTAGILRATGLDEFPSNDPAADQNGAATTNQNSRHR